MHQRFVQSHMPSGRQYLRLDEDFNGNRPDSLLGSLIEQFQEQLATGYLKYNEFDETFRPTVKGALLMTWSQLWPFKGMQANAMWANGRRLERRYG